MNLLKPLYAICLIALVSGCGRPPPAGGPPSDYSVNAVVAPVVNEPVSDIARVVGETLARVSATEPAALAEVLAADQQARATARQLLAG